MKDCNSNIQAVINLHVLMRDFICGELCGGEKNCANLECIEYFFRIAGQIEKRIYYDGHQKAVD